MKRIDTAGKDFLVRMQSSADSNKLYSILLDARASNVLENMFDMADRLVQSEKDNTKIALEQLWNLKKNLQGEGTQTVDLLIEFYQEKMDILRTREETIKKTSKDSRAMLEDKRKKDTEIATVKQEVADCTSALNELNTKLSRLKVKEQELTLIEAQLKKELLANENEIVNGLYEIILTPQQNHEDRVNSSIAKEPSRGVAVLPGQEIDQNLPEKTVSDETKELVNLEVLESPPDQTSQQDTEKELYITKQMEVVAYPKSVVKTTKGRVIGEYYYDSKAYKNKRSYVLNGIFFSNQLAVGVKNLKQHFNDATYSELLQMIQDTLKRIGENKNIQLEISTNEILNERAIKELWQQLKLRSYDEIGLFCKRYSAKIESLGRNYQVMLKEQMDRLTQGNS